MKWFVITNRVKSRNSFKEEPEKLGKVYFLSCESEIPEEEGELPLEYIGNTENSSETQNFVNQVKNELKRRSNILKRKKGAERKPSLVIYVHGYNTDYSDAVNRYVDFRKNFHEYVGKNNFEEQCLMVLFTWPSAGITTAYLEDRNDASLSSPAILNLVHILYTVTNELRDCISNVCVIAHSMGNYVFREALASLAGHQRSPAGMFIDQFIMIGADVSNNSLEPSGKGFGITRFSNRVSVYFSPHDSILSKSQRKNGRPRLGRTLSSGYINTPDNVVFIDCREWANDSKLEELFSVEDPPSIHSSYYYIPRILQDIYLSLCGVDREVFPTRERILMNKHYLLHSNLLSPNFNIGIY